MNTEPWASTLESWNRRLLSWATQVSGMAGGLDAAVATGDWTDTQTVAVARQAASLLVQTTNALTNLRNLLNPDPETTEPAPESESG